MPSAVREVRDYLVSWDVSGTGQGSEEWLDWRIAKEGIPGMENKAQGEANGRDSRRPLW